jgi:hypothetical protein
MKFEYRKEPTFWDTSTPWILRPIIDVQLSYQKENLQVGAIIDSGADCSVFSAVAARALGIDLQQGEHRQFFGVSEVPIDVYFHPIQFSIAGHKKAVEMEVGFTESSRVVGILGQRDFFEQYKVTFERYRECIEITPAKRNEVS